MKSGRAHPNYGTVDVAEAYRLRGEGLSNERIAARFGVCSASIWYHLGPCPDRCRGRRLWDEDDTRDRVRRLAWEGKTFGQITYLTGVPKSTAHEWVKGRQR